MQVAIAHVPAGWRLAPDSEDVTFATRDGRRWSSGWQRPKGWSVISPGSVAEDVCIPDSGAATLGLKTQTPLAVHVSVALGIVADEPPVRIKATTDTVGVPGVGQCRFEEFGPLRNYVLVCKSPVWRPKTGMVSITTEDGFPSTFPQSWHPSTPLNLLPGISPIYKWATLPSNTQIRAAIAKGGQLEFKLEHPVGIIRRELVVPEVRYMGLP